MQELTAPPWYNQLRRAFSRRASSLLDRHQPAETTLLLILAVVIGALTGGAAVLFIEIIDEVARIGFGWLPALWEKPGRAWLLVVPALGGLLAGPLIARYEHELKGSGIPVVVEAIVLRGGRLHPRAILTKIVTAGLCIGSGGSAGREGPIVQVGATIGSFFGQTMRMSEGRIRNLVACGAAAGIAAAFNAPIAGVAFAIEVLTGDMGLGLVSNVVIAAVTASVVSRIFLGDAPAFAVPIHRMRHPAELLLYILLGLAAALIGVLLIHGIDRATQRFENWRGAPNWLKPAIGGLMIGALAFFYPHTLDRLQLPVLHSRLALPLARNIPHILSSGFETIEAALLNPLPWVLLIMLLFLKLVATTITLGSGNSGGVFAPSLFLGAMLGGFLGLVFDALFPALLLNPTAFALAGMVAVFAGAARAPLTAILIGFEMSNDYAFIVPLMVTTITASVVAHRLLPESIYTFRLARRGIRLRHGRDVDVLDAVLVNEIMGRDIPSVPTTMTLTELERYFIHTHHHGAVVLDEEEKLAGIVTLADLDRALEGEQEVEHTPVASIMTRTLLVAHPDESIGAALQRMAVRDIGRMPVVDRRHPGRVVGVIRRGDIVRAYRRGIIRRDDMQDRANQFRISRRESGTEFVELYVRSGSLAAHSRVAALRLPPDCLLTTRRHGDHMHLLHGDDVLEPGDIILALCEPGQVAALQAMFD